MCSLQWKDTRFFKYFVCMKKTIFILCIIAAFAVSPKASAQDFSDNLETLIDWMTGEYDSKDQAEKDSNYDHVTMRMTRVWADKPNGAWLYVEQALASTPEKPYRQRMYFLSEITEDEYSMDIYDLPQPAEFVGAWKDTSPFDNITLFDLSHKSGCTVVIFYDGFQYGGSSRKGACKSERNGATYMTSDITLTEGSLEAWDRGYDGEGNQVWGPENAPYKFQKRK